MYPSELILHQIGIILASAAAFLALWLIPLTGKSKAWLFISTALILMAVERASELLTHAGMLKPVAHEIFSDSLWIVIFALLLAGILFIRSIFLERRATQATLEKQLDELQRFHNVSIGRELRMKALFDENQALKTRLKEMQQ